MAPDLYEMLIRTSPPIPIFRWTRPDVADLLFPDWEPCVAPACPPVETIHPYPMGTAVPRQGIVHTLRLREPDLAICPDLVRELTERLIRGVHREVEKVYATAVALTDFTDARRRGWKLVTVEEAGSIDLMLDRAWDPVRSNDVRVVAECNPPVVAHHRDSAS